MQNHIKSNKAFTLIELLVVIAIMGILSGFIFVSLGASIGAAKDAKRKADLSQIQKALLMYQVANNGYPILSSCTIGIGCLDAQLAQYIANLPTDPDTSKHYTYSSADGTSYTLQATLDSGATYSYANTGWTIGISGYAHYKTLTIINSSGSVLTNYPIKLSVYQATGQGSGSNCEGLCKTDFSDLAFTDSTGNTALPFWLETGSLVSNTSVTVWVNVPTVATGSTTSIRMYYNAASPTLVSSGVATFSFFDDFTGGTLSSQWGTFNISYSISNGIINAAHASSGGSSVVSTSSFGSGYSARFRSRCNSGSDESMIGFWGDSNQGAHIWNPINNSTVNARIALGTYSQLTTDKSNFHIYDTGRYSTTAYFSIDNGSTITLSGCAADSLGVGIFPWTQGSVYVDWVLVRKLVAPEPTTAFGSQN
jgi:prepilin-type N-terminal cleavage/methylation domain-containing protein